MKKILQFALCTLFVLGSLSAWAQRTITGTVLSGEDNSALPGANVVVKGTTTGAATDAAGNFSLTVPDGDVTLTISSIGFNSFEQIVAAGATTVAAITLGVNVQVLNEAVVVGYGTVNRKDVTGSIATISSKDFQKGQITSPEQLIAGKAAGVQIVTGGGRPGAGATIRIRGGSSLTASNDPLIVIDGVPVDNDGVAGSPSPLSLINPNDIETITILKDASSTAIYGSRASNGVILITTKKGVLGSKPTINLSSQNSISIVPRYVDVLSGNELRTLINEVGNPTQKAVLGTLNTNWQKQIYQPAFSTDNVVSLGGAYKTIPYRLSLGYLDQQGILKTDHLQRGTASLTLTPSFLDGHLKVNTNIKGTASANRFADQGAIGNAVSFDPTQPIRDTAGSQRFGGYYEYTTNGIPTNGAPRNPLAQLEQRDDQSLALRSLGNVQLDYAIHGFEDLRVNVNLGYDVSRGRGNVKRTDSSAVGYFARFRAPRAPGDTTSPERFVTGGESRRYLADKRNLLLETYLSYSKLINPIKTRVEALAGYSYQDFQSSGPNYRPTTFRGDTLNTPGFERPTFPDYFDQNRLISVYGRLNLSILDRYLFTATIRRDGSSRFAPNKRFGIFPSFAAAWRVSQEPFLKDATWLNDFKLRFGYGVTGQQDGIGNYSYLPFYTLSQNSAQYQIGDRFYSLYRPNAYDPNLKWETTETYNFGIDLSLFRDRVSATVDMYRRFTSDLLNNVAIPLGTNFSETLTTNVGNLTNTGIEIGLNLRPVSTRDWTWEIGLNYTLNRNELTKLTLNSDTNYLGVPAGGIPGGVGTTIQIQSVGKPINSFFVYQQLYDSDGRLIEGQFVDRNGNGVVDEADRYHYKRAQPPIFFGINTSVGYKRLTLSAVLRGAVDHYIYNSIDANLGRQNILFPNTSTFLYNGSDNLLTDRLRGLANGERQLQSDYWVQKADFIRVDNINLSYNVGDIIKDRVGLVVNLTAQNPLVFTEYTGIDPEQFDGIDDTFYPRPRVFVVGLNFNVR